MGVCLWVILCVCGCCCVLQVCSKQTGHAEVVAIAFDPSVITFRDLLDVFFTVSFSSSSERSSSSNSSSDGGSMYMNMYMHLQVLQCCSGNGSAAKNYST